MAKPTAKLFCLTHNVCIFGILKSSNYSSVVSQNYPNPLAVLPSPPTITQYTSSFVPALLNSKVKQPFHCIKSQLQFQWILLYQHEAPSFLSQLCLAEPSLQSQITSIALTSVTLSFLAYRIAPALLLLAVMWKLRLPIHTMSSTCYCGQLSDELGDHFFACQKNNKISKDHCLQDTLHVT
jgi:hypothetical protein